MLNIYNCFRPTICPVSSFFLRAHCILLVFSIDLAKEMGTDDLFLRWAANNRDII